MWFPAILLFFIGFLGISFGLTVGVFLQGGWLAGAFNVLLIVLTVGLSFFFWRTWQKQAHRLRGIGISPIPIFFELTMAAFGLLVFLHVLGDGDGSLGSELYLRLETYDTALHVLAGIAFGAGALSVRLPSSKFAMLLYAFLGAMSFGVAWEAFEWLSDQFITLKLWGGPQDSLVDLFADALGGGAVGLLAMWYYEHYFHAPKARKIF